MKPWKIHLFCLFVKRDHRETLLIQINYTKIPNQNPKPSNDNDYNYHHNKNVKCTIKTSSVIKIQ